MRFIQAYSDKHFKFIKNSLKREGLTEDEIIVNSKSIIFFLLEENKNIIGFVGLMNTTYGIPMIEYFYIAKKYRKKEDKFYKNLIECCKQLFMDNNIKKCLIDVKCNGKFKYLLGFTEKIVNEKPYNVKDGNAYFSFNVQGVNL